MNIYMESNASSAPNVVVLKGGTSAEREVSLKSGEQIAAALRSSGCTVEEFDTRNTAYIQYLIEHKPDVVYIALHGRGGEDGTMQGLLDLLGIPYVGSGVLASALAMDKAMTKRIYELAGLPSAPYLIAQKTPDFNKAAFMEEVASQLGEHVVVKPATEGSSIGMSIISTKAELDPALDLAFSSDKTVVVEQFIPGVELTVAVIGNDDLRTLPPIEITSEGAFYDYESKYQPGQSHHFIPARVGDEINERCQKLAIRAHRALGCRTISRTDFIVDAEGQPWALETNTLPGMTEVSLVPDAAKAAGYTFPQLCRALVDLALDAQ